MGRLLVVDDAMLMRRMIRDAALEAGWEVVGEAKDGLEAVALFAQLRPDLVTMDVVMPEMGGLQALREIKGVDPDARVVMVSALNQKQTIEEAIRDGALDFIVKPFGRDRIVRLLGKLRSLIASDATAMPEI
jgi:two-component system chemotaxis response regulator CheY